MTFEFPEELTNAGDFDPRVVLLFNDLRDRCADGHLTVKEVLTALMSLLVCSAQKYNLTYEHTQMNLRHAWATLGGMGGAVETAKLAPQLKEFVN